jgi:Fic family protein
MAELVRTVNQALKNNEAHPLIVITVLIVSFLAIHPFQDGNGRLSRVLTTLLLLRSGYTYVPYSSLESMIEQTKERYYIALRQTQSSIWTPAPDWLPWLT